MHQGKEQSQRLHSIIEGLQAKRGILFGTPTMLSPAVTDVAQELRRAAQEIEILACDLLQAQRDEAHRHRATLEG